MVENNLRATRIKNYFAIYAGLASVYLYEIASNITKEIKVH